MLLCFASSGRLVRNVDWQQTPNIQKFVLPYLLLKMNEFSKVHLQ